MSDHDNAVYSEVDASGKEFTMSENKCYGDVGYTKTNAESKAMRKAGSKSSCAQVSVFSSILIALLLATLGACIALGLEIAQLKSDTATHQESQSALANEILQLKSNTASQQESQNALVSRIESTEILLQQLTAAIEMVNSSLGSGTHTNDPAPSCAALPPSSPSGYYWVRASNGSAVRVYCDMTRSCGNITGGWARVAELDMTNSSHQCPSGLTQHNDSNIRTCRRMESSRGCSSAMINIPYSYWRVCGRVIAYQVGTTNAFARRSNTTLEGDYVDGVSC